MSNIKVVNLAALRANAAALRDVDQEHPDFKGLVLSIKARGFMGSIVGRPVVDANGVRAIEIIDGLHRFVAAGLASLTEIPVDIREDVSDEEALELQIMANHHKIDTKPMQYTAGLVRLAAANPLLTKAELAEKLGATTQWIEDRFSLQVITNPAIKRAIDDGRIPLGNAYALSKLPEEEHVAFADAAATENLATFGQSVKDRKKQLAAEKRQAGTAITEYPGPKPKFRKLESLLTAKDDAEILANIADGTDDPITAIQNALLWSVSLDEASITAHKKAWEEKQVAAAERKRIADVERVARKEEQGKNLEAEAAAIKARLSGKPAPEAGAPKAGEAAVA